MFELQIEVQEGLWKTVKTSYNSKTGYNELNNLGFTKYDGQYSWKVVKVLRSTSAPESFLLD